MKENQIRELVNELRDIAIEYHGTQQLRERIARTVRAALHHDLEKLNQPVSQTYELPQTQFGQIADLYEMQFDDGRTCAFHTDGAKAAQWLLACDGNKVQEYVRLERYQEAVIGNSPVIGIDMASEPDHSVEVRYLAPPGYVMVPKVVTPEIGNAINEVGQRCTCGNCSQRLWDLLLASAPVQVDIEMLASTLKNAPLAPSDNQGRPRAPVVPPAIEPDYKVIKSILPTANPDEYACCIAADMWNACRAAMLHGVDQPQNARQNIPENIPDGNSPAIPDDWVMVPKEPTQAMIKAWLSEVANWRGHVAGYKAALAAAPQHEVK
ncbi:TPA: hypothetical protein JEL58_002827 [Salmonella enterica subsp. enterica serovar Godesberg]|nr:hypothetical protein [Salmonella enterica]EBH5714806.1 hypothetical protein [Salmonella enterica subsp. enterica serovar Soerenga]EBR8740059.1 hypothetical protein [Salmonella enterica subsp. enterica serovar Godesberg]EDY0316871.1 hypothetical protein [Salmonella enterica subsp. enterica]EBD5722071.1 hypothetical protein [Salmonella enterica]